MINIHEFLSKNITGYSSYCVVEYEGKKEATLFTRHTSDSDEGYWFLEYPCQLMKVEEVTYPIDEFCKRYVNINIELEENTDIDDYINKLVIPMIVDNYLYEIENFQCSPYLPEEVDRIEIITEEECLKYLFNK